MKRTFADFFAGIGLAELGLRAAGWKCRFANDMDENKRKMYRGHFKKGRYKACDIYDLDQSVIPDVSLWWASFPCTDVSLAGYRAGLAGTQTGALMGLLNLLRQKDGQRPPLVVLENVTGFISSRSGEDFEETVRQLNHMGYSCDAFVLDALHFVPQSRPRLFIVGIFDQPFTEEIQFSLAKRDSALRSSQLVDFITGHRDLNWTIAEIPPPPKPAKKLANVLEKLPEPSPYWWSVERVSYLLNQMSLRHRAVIEELSRRPGIHYATVYRRMRHGKSMAEVRADDIAGCLRTPRGGSSRQIVVASGDGEIQARFMTPRECARLMGTPRYRIEVPDNQAYFGFGDAVCVPVVKWIATNLLNPLMQPVASSEHATTVATAAG